ncbi:hypothetical protein V5O48_008115 [Marasmius crinis-equi]|uniref:F-box domain-containing protein n=1 Tax=Marasmius crinis-equi TaxID=585013 RepID=A0ABR3FEU1_9AGAR
MPSIRSLPLEILRRIFCMCFMRFWKPGERPEGLALSTAVRLSHVCSSWRSIALSLPEIWTSINVVFGGNTGVPYHNALSVRTQHFLDRSKSMPLFIDFDASNVVDFGRALTIFSSLASHSQRWKFVRFILPGTETIRLPSLLPELRLIELHSSSFTVPSEGLVAPLLRKVYLRQNFNVDTALRFLDHLVIDSHVELSGCFGLSTPLTSITSGIGIVSLSGSMPYQEIFDCLTLPKLRELSLHSKYSEHVSDFPVRSFRSFLQRSKPVLDILAIRNFNMTTADLIAILSMIPSLSRLMITEPLLLHAHPLRPPLLGDEFLHWMIVSSDSRDVILPHLSHLYLGYQFSYFDSATLLDMLASRCRSRCSRRAGPWGRNNRMSCKNLERFVLERGQVPSLSQSALDKLASLWDEQQVRVRVL